MVQYTTYLKVPPTPLFSSKIVGFSPSFSLSFIMRFNFFLVTGVHQLAPELLILNKMNITGDKMHRLC